MIDIVIDDAGVIENIERRLGALSSQAPDILRLSINSAARKVRKSIVKQVGERYTIQQSVLKDRRKGAPTVSTARKGNLGAVIRSKGPVNDLVDFLVQPGSDGAKAKVLRSGGLKTLERGGVKAFITRFASGHIAVVQRQPGKTYGAAGASDRIARYGTPHNGAWPDMTRIVKLMGPAVPSMMANPEIQEQARELLYDVLNQEITKRIDKAIERGAGT